MKSVTARANANIALVKYWGKADSTLNIPAVPSLSMTLDGIGTTVSLGLSSADDHQLIIAGTAYQDSAFLRLKRFLEHIRVLFPFEGFFCIKTFATVPYSAGLASSASFFAALSKALDHHLHLGLDDHKLSMMARLGSASAARSIFGGLVGLYGGVLSHSEAHAFSLSSPLDLAMVIVLLDEGQKPLSSREAMNITASTSPFYDAFVKSAFSDFTKAQHALLNSAFADVGAVMEHSTLKMHASMWAAQPSINYLQPGTLELINLIYELRKTHGPIAFFTMDAGPNVKILCEAAHAPFISDFLSNNCNARQIRVSHPGSGAHIIDEPIL